MIFDDNDDDNGDDDIDNSGCNDYGDVDDDDDNELNFILEASNQLAHVGSNRYFLHLYRHRNKRCKSYYSYKI